MLCRFIGVAAAASSLFLAASPSAQASGPSLQVGVHENLVKAPTLAGTKASVTLARLAGLDSLTITAFWWPGLTKPQAIDRRDLRNMTAVIRLTGIPVYLTITHTRGRFAPLTEEDRADFISFATTIAREYPVFRKIIIGNEPNLNLFWAPQFDLEGGNAAAPAYGQLLAETYDALKAVSRAITVIGGAVSPRGHDNPAASSKSHSPGTFIRDLGAFYRESGRTKPIMDWFAFHPYQDNSSQAPTTRHRFGTTISIADYAKLIRALRDAFDGTPQPGSAIPIVYDEYGIESRIPARKARRYTGTEPASTKPVPEATQARYYRMAIQLAFCQPTVRGIMLFHTFDEPQLDRWQSGMYYVDRTPKSSLRPIRAAAEESRRGVIARCPGLRLVIKAKTGFPSKVKIPRSRKPWRLGFALRCNLDCRYLARLQRLPTRKTVLAARGVAVGKRKTRVRFPPAHVVAGRYRISLRLVAPVNPGPRLARVSRVFRLG